MHTSQGRLHIAPESGKTAIGLDGRQVLGQEGSFSIPGARCLSPMGPQMSPGCAERETGSPWAPLERADAGHGLGASSSHFQELRSQWRTGRARSFSLSHSFIIETFILEYYSISILILLLPSRPPKPSQIHGLFVIPYMHNIYISYVYIHTYTHILHMYILYNIYIIYTHTHTSQRRLLLAPQCVPIRACGSSTGFTLAPGEGTGSAGSNELQDVQRC